MRATIVVRYIGLILLICAGMMVASALVDLFYEQDAFASLIASALILASFGAFPMVFVPRAKQLTIRENLAIVSGGWFVVGFAGSLPYLLWGHPFTAANAIFESYSGFTTTGSTILLSIETLPKGLLFWRSATHWIGGNGIVLLALAILPGLTPIGHSLLKSEYSSLGTTPNIPRASEIARILLFVYCGLTLAETVALLIAGLPLFDSVTTAFATIATGGFSVRDASIASYKSVAVEMIVLLFMILAGTNFAFLLGRFRPRTPKRAGTTVALTYLGGLVAGTALVTINLVHSSHSSVWQALRYASFQVASVGTSSGFATADSAVWPALSQSLLVTFALVGASAGSTSGGIKVDRIVLFAKLLRHRFFLMLHPEGLRSIKLDGRSIEIGIAQDAMLFIAAYLGIVALGSLLVASTGVPVLESFTGTVACMGNIGPGLGEVGSMGNFAALPDIAKYVLCAVMVIGRIEIFGALLLFTRKFWR